MGNPTVGVAGASSCSVLPRAFPVKSRNPLVFFAAPFEPAAAPLNGDAACARARSGIWAPKGSALNGEVRYAV